jgi:hypothetical protein
VIPYSPGDPDRPRGYFGGFGDTGLQLQVDQLLGGKLSLPLGSTGALNLAYIWLDSDSVTTSGGDLVNGTAVYGGDVKFNLSGIGLEGSWSKSDLRYNGRNVNSDDDTMWTAKAMYNRDRWGVAGGYKRIEPLYSAPGDWGRIGIWWNPTDIKGWHANAWFDISKDLRLAASGEWYSGTDTTIFGTTGLSDDDKINRYVVGLEYKFATTYNLALGYEEVDWDLADRPGVLFTGGKPRERWYNIGMGFDLGNRAKLSVLWQISDYDGRGVFGFNPFSAGSNASTTGFRATGGLITTQLSIKF